MNVQYIASVHPEVQNYSNEQFLNKIQQVLNDPKGWNKYGYYFEYVGNENTSRKKLENKNILVIELSPKNKIARMFPGFEDLSVYVPSIHSIFINANNFFGGSKSDLPVDDYQTYVINHEVGHALGLPHNEAPKDKIASIMQQQSKGPEHIYPAKSNPYPRNYHEYNEFYKANLQKRLFVWWYNNQLLALCILIIFMIAIYIVYNNTYYHVANNIHNNIDNNEYYFATKLLQYNKK